MATNAETHDALISVIETIINNSPNGSELLDSIMDRWNKRMMELKEEYSNDWFDHEGSCESMDLLSDTLTEITKQYPTILVSGDGKKSITCPPTKFSKTSDRSGLPYTSQTKRPWYWDIYTKGNESECKINPMIFRESHDKLFDNNRETTIEMDPFGPEARQEIKNCIDEMHREEVVAALSDQMFGNETND